MKIRPLILALSLGPGLTAAQEQLQTLVVTGYATDLARAPASVEIVTRAEIERQPAFDIADILRFHTGLEIGRNGGPGQATSLFIRGTESDHNLVMIDGVPINSGSVGSAALQHIDPQLIERIEIYKGPRATLWGSGAIGGVINIVTRRDAQGLAWSGGLEVGEEQTLHANGRLAWGDGTTELSAGLAHERTDGFPPLASSNLDAGYRNSSLDLAAGHQLGAHRFDAQYWHTQGNVEYLDYFGNRLDQDFLNSRASLAWTLAVNERWTSLLELAEVRDHIDQNQSNDSVHTDRTELKWQNDLDLADDHLVLGFKYSWESVEAQGGWSPYDSDTRIQELWAQYHLERGPHQLIAGFRYLDHEDAGSKPTWSLNYGYRWTPATTLWASVATAFRVPSANERFGFGGNPDLEPEESTSYELGLRHRPAPGHQVGVSLYRNEIDNLIQWVMTDPATWAGYNQNVARARIDGLELNYDFQGQGLSLHLGGAWQDPKDRDTDQRLLRRAYYSLNARLGYDFGPWQLGADLLHSGDRKDFGDVTLDPYTLVNLDASYRIAPRWRLHLKLENAFDETYQLAEGYNSAGRTAYLGINYR